MNRFICLAAALASSSSVTGFSVLPSNNHVMTTSTARSVGTAWNHDEGDNSNPIREFVKDMLRVFDIHHDNTEFHPIAFSGDIGNGPTTAYDALPPKPWKAPTVVEEAPPKHRHETNQFVKDSMRVFVHEKDGYATGFSGDIGNGPTTAYDALPPKPWNPSV